MSQDMLNYCGHLLEKYSDARKLFRIIGYVLEWFEKKKSQTDGTSINALSPSLLLDSKKFWIQVAQEGLRDNLQQVTDDKNKKV